MKGLVEMFVGWFSGFCFSLVDFKSLKEEFGKQERIFSCYEFVRYVGFDQFIYFFVGQVYLVFGGGEGVVRGVCLFV